MLLAMKYKVNEIFHSVQAEGENAGRAAVFVRFAGCNLKCPFCDTNHEPFIEMTGEEINAEITRLAPDRKTLVVFTGGEPLLQLSSEEVLADGYPRAVETNGIFSLPSWWGANDWCTVSPKCDLTSQQLSKANEVKLLHGLTPNMVEACSALPSEVWLYVQPIERNGKFDVMDAINFIQKNPRWKLSVQWHKITGVR